MRMIIRSKVDRIVKVDEAVVDPWLRMHSIVCPNLEIMSVVGGMIGEVVDVMVVAAVEEVEEETETETCLEIDVVGMNLKKKLIFIL